MKKGLLDPTVNSLEKVKDLSGGKLAYAVIKNKKAMIQEVEILQELYKKPEAYAQYDKERIALCEKYAKKDEKGKSIMILNEYQFEPENRKIFDKEVEKLGETHKETVEAYKKQVEDANKLLEEEAEIEIHKVNIDDIPENITIEQMEVLDFMITEEKIEKKK